MVADRTDRKRMAWDEMVSRYSDMWVVVDDAELSGPDIVSGIVVDAVSDDDIGHYQAENFEKGYEYCRTTEGFFNGITGSSIVISVD